MVRDVEFQHPLADAGDLVGLGADHHAVLDGFGARCGEAAPAFDLDQADAAGAEGVQIVGGAELGDVEGVLARRPHDRGADGNAYRLPVDREFHHRRATNRAITVDGRRSEVGNGDAHGRKSSGNRLIALVTGMGVMPPIWQRLAVSITSQRSSIIANLSSAARPSPRAWMTASMVSLPRTAPRRQGVHLPHDSTSQNSNA